MLVEFLLELFFDVVFPSIAEWLVELGWLSVKASAGREQETPAWLAWIGLFLIGMAVGGGSLAIWPYRVAGAGPFPGASLIASPVLNGLVMDALGRRRGRRGRPRTHASTFWGGAIFALGIALVRFCFVPGFPPLPLER